MRLNMKQMRWLIFVVLFSATMVFSVFFRGSTDQKVSAAITPAPGNVLTNAQINAGTFKFNDIGHIIGTFGPYSYVFEDNNPLDPNPEYQIVGYGTIFGRITLDCTVGSRVGCITNIITANNLPDVASRGAKLDMDWIDNPNATPVNSTPPVIDIDVTDGGSSRILFYFVDANRISSVLPSNLRAANGTFTKSTVAGQAALFIKDTDIGIGCGDRLTIVAGGQVRFYENDSGGAAKVPPDAFDPGCAHTVRINLADSSSLADDMSNLANWNAPIITLGSAGQELFAFVNNPAGGFVPGSGNAAVARNSCANVSGPGGFALRWLLCPVIELLDAGINWLDTNIQAQLITPDPTTFSQASQMHEAWGRIRNVALIILVPIMLFMVIGTAIGMSFLDAYTVRRAMPRFLIAVVFISTSWYITAFLINLTNAVGTGILGLMTQPFGGPSNSLGELIGIGGEVATSLGSLVIFGSALAFGAVTLGVVVSYAFVAILVLLLGFFLLTIRQLLILTLVLIAPLAILSWIFPNSDKLWKLWWGTFSRLLLVFPIIMMLIGAGKIFAYVVASIS